MVVKLRLGTHNKIKHRQKKKKKILFKTQKEATAIPTGGSKGKQEVKTNDQL